MTIIVFLVDTSASMNQRTYMGTTLLDVVKGAVETFMKIRSRDPNSRWDRYMLLTFEDPPGNVKAGWKESHATFIKELKNLQALGLSTLGPALRQTFDLLNVNRMQSGIDTYGQGRCPFYLEPAIIICLTDGRKMTTTTGATNDLWMTNALLGSELTKEPFRWDQRLFGVVLRIPAHPPFEQLSYIPPAEDTAVDAMCEVTGGRSYAITSQRTLLQCLESLVQKCQSGVVVSFEKIGNDLTTANNDNDINGLKRPSSPSPSLQSYAWQSCRKLIYVPRSAQKGYTVGYWPIPESFWPDINSPTLPPRSAHPVLRFSCTPTEPVSMENLPYDKYELEPSPLTQYILERRQPNVAWQVFIANSAKYNDIGHPFGYLKASGNQTSVNLFVMPYNYPQLVTLLDELFKVHKLKPPPKWRQQFDSYLKTMPIYYASPLKRALQRMGSPPLVPDQIENCLSYAVVSYLKKLKNQAKIEYDRLVASVGQSIPLCQGIKVTSRSSRTSILQRTDFHQLLAHHCGDMSSLKQELNDFDAIMLRVHDGNETKAYTYTNPFDISRKDLLDHIVRMRINFLKLSLMGTRLQDEENLHNISVQDMGNYQEFLKKQPSPLREIETMPVRQHTFGNPFKVNKMLMIDEADEAMPGQSPGAGRKRPTSDTTVQRPNKRKPGPLPRDVPARSLMSPIYEFQPQSPSIREPVYLAPSPLTITDDESEDDDAMSSSSERANHVKDGGGSDSAGHECIVANHVKNVPYSEMNGGQIDLTGSDDDVEINGDVSNGSSTKLQISITNNHVATLVRSNSEMLDQHNLSLLRLALKEIKRPGKDYTRVFEYLRGLHGSADIQSDCVRKVIAEAARFKRHKLITLLEDFVRTQVSTTKSSSGQLPLTNRRHSSGSKNELVNNNVSHKYNNSNDSGLHPAGGTDS